MVPSGGRLLFRFAFIRRGECCVVLGDSNVPVQEKNICIALKGGVHWAEMKAVVEKVLKTSDDDGNRMKAALLKCCQQKTE